MNSHINMTRSAAELKRLDADIKWARRCLVVGVLCLVILALAGCNSERVRTSGPKYRAAYTADDHDRMKVTLVVHWYDTREEMQANCKGSSHLTNACASINEPVKRIHIVRGSGWNDSHTLWLLGHELSHAMGAMHEHASQAVTARAFRRFQ